MIRRRSRVARWPPPVQRLLPSAAPRETAETSLMQTIVRLADYRPSDYLIDRVDLDVRLHPTETRVTATLALRPNPNGEPGAPLVLDGDELTLLAIALDGQPTGPGAIAVTPRSLTLHHRRSAPSCSRSRRR